MHHVIDIEIFYGVDNLQEFLNTVTLVFSLLFPVSYKLDNL